MAVSFFTTFKEHCAKADDHGRTALVQAVLDNDMDSIASLAPFERGWADADGYTALMHAVLAKNKEAIGLLIDFEYPFVLQDSRTALMLAVEHHEYELAPLLANRLLKMTDKHGYSALMHAVVLGDIEMVRVLISHWPGIGKEDLSAALDVVELGLAESRDAVYEMLKQAMESAHDLPGGRVLCTGVVPKMAIPGALNGVYPIGVHFSSENAFSFETEKQLCDTISTLHTKIRQLEEAQSREKPKMVSTCLSACQQYSSIGLQTPLDWEDKSYGLAKLTKKLNSKQQKIQMLKEEIATLQEKVPAAEDAGVYFKEASELRMKERALKERVRFLEKALDEHIGIINGVLHTQCKSLMDVENSVRAVAMGPHKVVGSCDISLARNVVDRKTGDKNQPVDLAGNTESTYVCSPITAIQDISAAIKEPDAVPRMVSVNVSVQTLPASPQIPIKREVLSDPSAAQQQLIVQQSLLNKIQMLVEGTGEFDGVQVSESMLLPVIERIFGQCKAFRAELEAVREEIRQRDVAANKLQSIISETGVLSVDALETYIRVLRKDAEYYRMHTQGALPSSAPAMPAITSIKETCTSDDFPQQRQVQGLPMVCADIVELPALFRQISRYTQQQCTSVREAMQLVHGYCTRVQMERTALQSMQQDIQREHTIATNARMALAKQETINSSLMDKHALLINDMQLLTARYNALGEKYNLLCEDNARIRSVSAASPVRRVHFADDGTQGEPALNSEASNPVHAQGDVAKEGKVIKASPTVKLSDAIQSQAMYVVSATKDGHMHRSIGINQARELINQHILNRKKRSQSSASGSLLYPGWHCCKSEDISRWFRRPLY